MTTQLTTLTIAQAATVLGLTRQHVRVMVWEGKLAASKDAVGHWQIAADAVAAEQKRRGRNGQ